MRASKAEGVGRAGPDPPSNARRREWRYRFTAVPSVGVRSQAHDTSSVRSATRALATLPLCAKPGGRAIAARKPALKEHGGVLRADVEWAVFGEAIWPRLHKVKTTHITETTGMARATARPPGPHLDPAMFPPGRRSPIWSDWT